MYTKKQILDYPIEKVRSDYLVIFGDLSDGAIELIGSVKGGLIEVGYFYGDTKPKNIVVTSSQVGCPIGCKFCELGDLPFIRNLTTQEMKEQVMLMLRQAGEAGHDLTRQHKISWAKSGEPLMNPNFISALENLVDSGFSHKVSSVFPAGRIISERFRAIADFASAYTAPVQIQISLISLNEAYRTRMTRVRLAPFEEIRKAAEYWRAKNPNGRKINLSLMATSDNPLREQSLVHFPPELFRFRVRDYAQTVNGASNRLEAQENSQTSILVKTLQEKGYEADNWGKLTPMEQKYGLASNVTLRRYLGMIQK